jgi:bacteriocin biosynthesis cyclodehydratase domain-containing protein
VLWRDRSTLQVGVRPERGVVVSGLQPGDEVLVEAMDGLHDVVALQALAASVGVPADRVEALVTVLAGAGVVSDAAAAPPLTREQRDDVTRLGAARRARLAPDAAVWAGVYLTEPRAIAADGVALVAARTRRHVLVEGAGPLADAIATTLAAAGVGTVSRARTPQTPRADVHVLVRTDAIDVCEADALVATDQVHLAVLAGGDRLVVGPLVLPGRSACLRCLDLHRADRDPAWPHVVAQLVRQRTGPPPRETASTVLAAGLAALQVLTQLDGCAVPASVGRTLEVELPDGLVERRRWPPHPSCGCQALAVPRALSGRSGSGAAMRASVP